MSCRLFQRRLLEADNPELPPPDVQDHLAGCFSCRAWQRRLVQFEHQIPLLPIPTSAGPAAVLRWLRREERGSRSEERVAGQVQQLAGKLRTSLVDPRWRRWRLAGAGIAAAVALVMLSWWAIQRSQGTARPTLARKGIAVPDPLVARLLQRDLRLAGAQTPRDRLTVLAALASDLHVATQTLARTADVNDLQELAGQYQRVVQDGVVRRARDVPSPERRRVLDPIVRELARTGREAETLAEQVPTAAGPLQRIAAAARDGDSQLRTLLREKTS